MQNIQNLTISDPFADAGEFTSSNFKIKKIHLRVQQRNGKKMITIIEGVPEEFDYRKLLKTFKKTFGCNGTIAKDDDDNSIMQLSGDQRHSVSDFLIDEEIATGEQIVIHGF